jgi:hypothetical protein
MDTGAEVGPSPSVTAADPECANKDAGAPPAKVPADAGAPPLVAPADLAPDEAAPTRAIGVRAAAAVTLWEAAPPSVLSTPARAAAKATPGEEGSPEREFFGDSSARRACGGRRRRRRRRGSRRSSRRRGRGCSRASGPASGVSRARCGCGCGAPGSRGLFGEFCSTSAADEEDEKVVND